MFKLLGQEHDYTIFLDNKLLRIKESNKVLKIVYCIVTIVIIDLHHKNIFCSTTIANIKQLNFKKKEARFIVK